MAQAAEAPVAQPEPGNGTVPPEVVETPGVQNDSVETQGPAKGERFDFEEKVRTDPDFALDQVKSNQSRADRLQGEIDKLKRRIGGLDRLLAVRDGAGDEIATWASAAMALHNNPDYRAAVEAVARGDSPPPPRGTQDPDDEYREPWEEAIQSLEQKFTQSLSRLEQGFGGLTRKQAKEEFHGHFDSVLSEFDFTEKERERVLAGAEADISRMDPQIVANLDRDNVYAVLLRHLDPATIRAASDRRVRREAQERSSRATDVPTGERAAQTAHAYSGSPNEVALQALRDIRAGRVKL